MSLVLIVLNSLMDSIISTITWLAALSLLIVVYSFFVGFSTPPAWFFRGRHLFNILYFGTTVGILRAVEILITAQGAETHISRGGVLHAFLFWALVWVFVWWDRRSEKLRVMRECVGDEAIVLFDAATFVKPENHATFAGSLVLSRQRLSFYLRKSGECFVKELSACNPTMTRSRFLKIPDGFTLSDNGAKVFVAFPRYWMAAMEKAKSEGGLSIHEAVPGRIS